MSAILRNRLLAAATAALIMLVPACGSDEGSAPTTTTAARLTTTTAETTTTVDNSAEKAELKLVPVLSVTGCPALESTTPTPTTAPATDSTPSTSAPGTTAAEPDRSGDLDGLFPTADGVYCHTVGEPFGDGNDLHDATVADLDGAYQVMVRVKPESKEKLNAGFNSCFNGQPECPAGPSGRGSAAFVLDGVVLLAPAIAVEDMADEVFLIATGLTEREARGLISKINR